MLHLIKKLFGIKPAVEPVAPAVESAPYKVPEPAAATPIPLVVETAPVVETVAVVQPKKTVAKKVPAKTATKKPATQKKPAAPKKPKATKAH